MSFSSAELKRIVDAARSIGEDRVVLRFEGTVVEIHFKDESGRADRSGESHNQQPTKN